eukprot:1852966-Ditylum_brightwellii.AAC.1
MTPAKEAPHTKPKQDNDMSDFEGAPEEYNCTTFFDLSILKKKVLQHISHEEEKEEKEKQQQQQQQQLQQQQQQQQLVAEIAHHHIRLCHDLGAPDSCFENDYGSRWQFCFYGCPDVFGVSAIPQWLSDGLTVGHRKKYPGLGD